MRYFIFCIFLIAEAYPAFSQTGTNKYTREWGTYFGRIADSDVDEDGNLWVVSQAGGGATFDTLVTPNAHQTDFGGEVDIFISKFSPEGELLYATYFGGEGDDRAFSIDVQGNKVYLTGQTYSAQNIATPDSHQENLLQNTDPNGDSYSNYAGYIAQFNTSGVLQWSTYFQGDQASFLWSIAADDDNVYVWGMTNSSDMATSGSFRENVPPPFLDSNGEFVAPLYPILAKFNDTGELQWATYYGPDIGSGINGIGHTPHVFSDGGLAIDASGNVYVGGRSDDTEGYYGTFGAHQEENAGNLDIFFSKFSPSGDLLWSTYYGGAEHESHSYIHIGRDDSFYVTGRTYSTTNIATSGSYQSTLVNTNGNVFLVKFQLNGQRQWGTYFATGNALNVANVCFANETGEVFLAGVTEETSNTTTPGSWQEEYMDKDDIFAIKFNSTGSDLLWGSYYGGFETEGAGKGSLAVTEDDELYITGYTGSFSGIASEGSFIDDPETGVFYYGGFIAKFVPCSAAIIPTGDSEQGFLSGDNLDSLEVNFTDWSGSELIITWYADTGGTEVLPPSTILEDGETYYVSQQIRGCDESGLLAITVTETMGVADQTFTNLKLYPNPNNGKFTISGLPGDGVQVRLYDIRGREVYSNDFGKAKSIQIDLKGQLRTGIYFLEVSTLGATDVIRVLIE